MGISPGDPWFTRAAAVKAKAPFPSVVAEAGPMGTALGQA